MKTLPTRSAICLVVSLGLLCLSPTRTAAWGSKGHQIIARIAMERLSDSARQSIAALLGPKETIESVSTWADQISLQRRDTSAWHFVEIPVIYNNYDRKRDCPKGKCIVEAINEQIEILRDNKRPDKERADALRFLVHLIGDLHQPFHVTTNADPKDSGANRVKVISLSGRASNLHAIWDDDIVNNILSQAHVGLPEYAAQLSSKIRRDSTNPSSFVSTQGSVTDWALETHRLAPRAYGLGKHFMVADHRVWKLDEPYYKQNRLVVENQLLKAGARLAKILNESFGYTVGK